MSRDREFLRLSGNIAVSRREVGRCPLWVAAPAPDNFSFLFLDGLLFHPLSQLGWRRLRSVLDMFRLPHIDVAGLGLLPLANGAVGLVQPPASSRADGRDGFAGVLFHLFFGGYSGIWFLFLPPLGLLSPVAVLHQFSHAPGDSTPDRLAALLEWLILSLNNAVLPFFFLSYISGLLLVVEMCFV